MTIDELIDLAVTNLAYIPGAIEHKRIMEYIGTAQAAAATAQAMILAQMTDTIQRPGFSDRRILNVDTGS